MKVLLVQPGRSGRMVGFGDLIRPEPLALEILAACVREGGTLSGEHGIGVEKQKSMPLRFGAVELNTMAAAKRAWDPANLMNPGKVLPPESDGAGKAG